MCVYSFSNRTVRAKREGGGGSCEGGGSKTVGRTRAEVHEDEDLIFPSCLYFDTICFSLLVHFCIVKQRRWN